MYPLSKPSFNSKIFKLLLSVLIVLTISSTTFAAMPTDIENYSSKLGEFSLNLFDQIVSSQPSQNVVFSPFSIQACGALARIGAVGETAAELDKGLVLPSSDVTKMSETFHNILTKYQNSSLVSVANKVYVMQNYKIKEQFNQLASKNFYSTAEEINFASSNSAAKTMNDWVELKTNNLIKNLISPSAVDANTRVVLLNAIHFKGEWQHPFSKDRTKEDRFYLNDKDFVNVPMMNLKERFRYADIPELDAKALEMPYNNSDLSMLILLPNSKTGLQNLQTQLKNVTWADINDKLAYQQVVVKMPKFKAEFSIELSDPLKKLGISRMFSDSAEFDNMLESKEPLQVSKVIHKAFIDLNEEGTEAAGATAALIRKKRAINLSIVFHAEHPFMYLIIDKTDKNSISNHFPMFMGNIVTLDDCSSPSVDHDEL